MFDSIRKSSLYHRLRVSARTQPLLFLIMEGMSSKRQAMSRDWKLVIDGYPRSANSYAIEAMLVANPGLKGFVGSHAHSPAQLVWAKWLKIPAVFLIREPVSAVTSYLAYQKSVGRDISVATGIRDYITHNTIAHRTMDWSIVADFGEVVNDFSAVIKRINTRFGSDFALYDRTEENETAVFDAVLLRNTVRGGDRSRASIPRAERSQAKEEMQQRVCAEAALLARAQDLYERILAEGKH